MRFVVVLILAAACGSSSNNAGPCDDTHPCKTNEVCVAGSCMPSECTTSADCTTADNPICSGGLCVAACMVDMECTGIADRPFCDNGACVGCKTAMDCPAEKAFCDAGTHACRGCISDDECASGVCLDFEGVCAASADIIHVKQFGTDTGTCTELAPCETINYAMTQVTATRKIIRIAGGVLTSAPTTTVTINKPVIIDASGTQINKPTNGPLFALSGSGIVIVEGLTLLGNSTMPSVTVGAGSTFRMFLSTLQQAVVDVMNGSVAFSEVKANAPSFDTPALTCTSGTVNVDHTLFNHTTMTSSNCQVTVSRSTFDGVSDGSITSTGGLVKIENNLIIEANELSDSMNVTSAAPGSTIRFNTFVNTSGINSDGVALFCDDTSDVSNNIFAYRSMHPMGAPGGTPCATNHSLFDFAAVATHAAGEGNKIGDVASFFASLSTRDFHLAANSPAKESAQPNLVTVDLDGKARPTPSGTNPDMGCYEAP